jgi:hypothetical protein
VSYDKEKINLLLTLNEFCSASGFFGMPILCLELPAFWCTTTNSTTLALLDELCTVLLTKLSVSDPQPYFNSYNNINS